MKPLLLTLRDQLAARVAANDPLSVAELRQALGVIDAAVERYETAVVLTFKRRDANA